MSYLLFFQEENLNLARASGLRMSAWIFEYISNNDFPNIHTHISWAKRFCFS